MYCVDSEPFASLLYWILDLCVLISSHSAVNKMTPQNLAIVFAPNLFKTMVVEDPLAVFDFVIVVMAQVV